MWFCCRCWRWCESYFHHAKKSVELKCSTDISGKNIIRTNANAPLLPWQWCVLLLFEKQDQQAAELIPRPSFPLAHTPHVSSLISQFFFRCCHWCCCCCCCWCAVTVAGSGGTWECQVSLVRGFPSRLHNFCTLSPWQLDPSFREDLARGCFVMKTCLCAWMGGAPTWMLEQGPFLIYKKIFLYFKQRRFYLALAIYSCSTLPLI